MTPWELNEYKRLRSQGWRAQQALRAARVRDRFTDLEDVGLVKIEAEPEFEVYDDTYIDTWGLSPEKVKQEKKKLWALIEREGCWIYTSYFRRDDKSEWIAVDSVGMCIGHLKDSGYDVDLMAAAIEALESEESLMSKYN